MRTVRLVVAILAAALIPLGPVWAEGPPKTSLFFTADEAVPIDRALAQAASAASGSGDIRLDAILYYGPQDWTLWMQGERWTPATASADLRIVAVSAEAVQLSLPGVATGVITLKPHQTYRRATGDIVESSP